MELAHVLARAFSSMAVSIDLADDEDMDPDIAADIIEPAAALFKELSEDDRRALAAIIVEVSELESDPVRKRSMLNLPEEIGLLEEE
ncbi:phage tail assembly chaperone [Streptomyces sp. NBC_00347]|uniref:phage tail assembly chaperone n=1 Tax=Streptomyces sp. NBC_00347 TaxID=2975721 RepID=UPI00225103C4|nr:hypothetical protein [Streptomyces sp. NBC_00347]MCX5122908.1 hypothetical protein [Streptomyces sp. NBC_00347]